MAILPAVTRPLTEAERQRIEATRSQRDGYAKEFEVALRSAYKTNASVKELLEVSGLKRGSFYKLVRGQSA